MLQTLLLHSRKTSPKNDDLNNHIHNDIHKDKSNNEQYSDFSYPSYSHFDTSISIINDPIANSSCVNSITDSSYNINYSKASDSICSISDDTVNDALNFQENWRGLVNKDIQKCSNIKKKSYLDKCPEWENIESTDAVFISIMKNGNLCQSVKLLRETVMIRNTINRVLLMLLYVKACAVHI